MRPRIGQLLVESGIVEPLKLHSALATAVKNNQHIGQVLVREGYLHARELQSALRAQTLVAAGALTERAAVQAVRTAACRKKALTEVLNEIPLDRGEFNDSGLGKLLVNAGVISEESHQAAKAKSKETGLPLGRVLLLRQEIEPAILDQALTLLLMVTKAQIDDTQAQKLLREVRRSQSEVHDAVSALRMKTIIARPLRPHLGRLLARAKAISEVETVVAVERALNERRLLGEILVNSGLIAPNTLEDALKVQTFVERGLLTLQDASKLLEEAQKSNVRIRQVISEREIFRDHPTKGVEIIRLLKEAGVIADLDVARAANEFDSWQMGPSRALLASGKVSRQVYAVASDCVDRVTNKLLNREQAVSIIKSCQNQGRNSLDSTLNSLGLAPSTPSEEPDLKAQTQTHRKQVALERTPQIASDRIGSHKNLVKLLQVASLICMVLCTAVYLWGPISYRLLALCVLLLTLGAGLMKLGFTWREEQKQIASK